MWDVSAGNEQFCVGTCVRLQVSTGNWERQRGRKCFESVDRCLPHLHCFVQQHLMSTCSMLQCFSILGLTPQEFSLFALPRPPGEKLSEFVQLVLQEPSFFTHFCFCLLFC